jgi:hypothetical protein
MLLFSWIPIFGIWKCFFQNDKFSASWGDAPTRKITIIKSMKKVVFSSVLIQKKIGFAGYKQAGPKPGANPAIFEFTATTPALG